MFKINKDCVATYWSVHGNCVTQRTGEFPLYFSEFETEEEAIDYAINQQQARLIKIYNSKYQYSFLVMRLLKFRALWSSNVKKYLKKYYKELDKAKDRIANPPKIQVTRLPQYLEVKGERLVIGAKVYLVRSDVLTLEIVTVISEQFHYPYNNKCGIAEYGFDNKLSIYSNSRQASLVIYNNREDAENYLKICIHSKISKLYQQLKDSNFEPNS